MKGIASGNGSQQDLDELNRMLSESEDNVIKAGERLKKARDNLISTNWGMSVANDVDSVIFKKLGPGAIRPRLWNLAESEQLDAGKA